MNHTSYIDDIRKLMDARDRAVNENEAAAAAGIIARLCAKHNISEEEIIGREIEMGAGDALSDMEIDLATGMRITNWHIALVTGVKGATFTSVIILRDPPRIRIFGRKKNIETYEYLWMYLTRTIKDVAREKQGIDRALGIKRGKSWWNTWYHGCVNMINQRLKESVASTIKEMGQQSASRELVVTNKFALLRQESRQALDKAYPRQRSLTIGSCGQADAWNAGQQAGSKISLPGGGIGHSGTGPKGLIG